MNELGFCYFAVWIFKLFSTILIVPYINEKHKFIAYLLLGGV